MARRDRWRHPVEERQLPGPERPGEDNCCCPWFKPKSKSNERSDAPKLQQGQGTAGIPNRNSNGSKKQIEKSDAATKPQGTIRKGQGNKNSRFVPEMEPMDSKPGEGNSNGRKNSWFVPEMELMDSKSREGNSNGRSDAPKVQQWQETLDIPKGNSNGSNKNTWSDNMQPNDSSGVSRDQRVIPKNNKYTEIDPVETTKNGDIMSSKGSKCGLMIKKTAMESPRNMKPSPQNQKISSPHKISSPGQDHRWVDNKQEESKKEGKNTGPNSTNVTKSMDGVYSSEEKQRSNIIPKEEDNDGSYGGTRPDSTKNKGNHGGPKSDPTKSSTFEQADPWKEKENDRIKNRQEDILEDHRKAFHKPEYNHRIDRDKGNYGGTRSDPTKSSTFENDRIKNRYEGILEDHDNHKGVRKPEYNHGLDLTQKESSKPDSEQASVQKRRGKQGINTNNEYTNPTNPSTKGFSHASMQ